MLIGPVVIWGPSFWGLVVILWGPGVVLCKPALALKGSPLVVHMQNSCSILPLSIYRNIFSVCSIESLNFFLLQVYFPAKKRKNNCERNFKQQNSCKRSSINQMAAGSRLSWCIMEFFSSLQLFKHTVLNSISSAGRRTWCPTDLQHLCYKALINK